MAAVQKSPVRDIAAQTAAPGAKGAAEWPAAVTALPAGKTGKPGNAGDAAAFETTSGDSPRATETASGEFPARYQKGIISSATSFAADTVKGAACLATGAAVAGVELGVGAGAKVFDAASIVIRSGVETVRSIKERGHEVTTGTIETVREAVTSCEHRGQDVIDRVTHTTARIASGAGHAGAKDLNSAAEIAGGAAAKARNAGSHVLDAATEGARAVKNNVADAAGRAKKTEEKAVDKGTKIVRSAVDKAAGVADAFKETVAGTAREVEQQGERAAREGANIGHAALDKIAGAAGDAASKAKETGKEYAKDKGGRAVQDAQTRAGHVAQSSKAIGTEGADDISAAGQRTINLQGNEAAGRSTEASVHAKRNDPQIDSAAGGDKMGGQAIPVIVQGGNIAASKPLPSHDSATDLSTMREADAVS